MPRVRFVFSVSVRDVQLGSGGPPGTYEGEAGWRAVTRVLRSCEAAVEWIAADLVEYLDAFGLPGLRRRDGEAGEGSSL